MTDAPIAALLDRLRYIRGNMGEVLETFDEMPPPSHAVLRVRIERWVQAVDSVIAQGEAHVSHDGVTTIPVADLNSSNDE